MAPMMAVLIICGWYTTLTLALQLSSVNAFNVSSSPTRITTGDDDDDDPRFALRTEFGETDVPVTPVFMSVVELMAQYAEMDFLGKAQQRNGIVLPTFPQIEIAIIPAPPASTIEVRLIIWALYGAVLDMTFHNKFKEIEVPFSWDGVDVGYLYITIPEAHLSAKINANGTRQVTDIANSTKISTSSTNTSTPSILGIGQFGWTPVYKPDGQILPPRDVFILTMGLLKGVAPNAAADRVLWPIQMGSDMVDAHADIQLQGQGSHRSRPPYFQFGHIIEAARRIPGWMLEHRKFAEVWIGIKSNSRFVGLITYVKGPYRPEVA